MQKGMDPHLWPKVKSIFEAALDLPPAERESFIDVNARGEPEVAGRLRRMLEAHAEAASLLDRPLPERLQSLADGAAGETANLTPGMSLGGRYKLVRELGRGGNGFVWQASDESVLGRSVALKVLRPGARGESFDTELIALAKLDHRSIAAPIDSGLLEDGRRFLVIEHVNGPSLRELLRAGPLEPMRACRLIGQIANALDAAHRHGVWHLDLKPENVMIRGAGEADEQAVLVDFGISRLTGADHTPHTPAGSLAYASREQLAGAPSSSSDQYSLARMAVEMITGHRPEVLEPPDALLARCGALRHRVVSALERALRSSPEERFPQASQFAAELQAALDPKAAAARSRRLLAAAFCFLLFTVMAVYVWFNREREHVTALREAQVTSSLVDMAAMLLEVGHFDQNLLHQTILNSIRRLKALEKSGRRDPELLEALFGAQMRFAALHGHPAVPHLGSIELGLQAYNGAQRTLDLLFEGRPKDHNYTRKLIWVRDSLASTLIEAGQYDRSEAVCRESLLLIDKLESASWPASLANNMRGSTLMTLSRAPFHKKQWEECLALRNEGVRLKRLVASALRDPAYERDLAGVLAARGYLLREMGRIEEALDDYRKSDAIVIKLVEQGLKNVNTDWLLARNRLEEGKAELYRNNAAEAERLLSGALRVHRMLAAELPLAVSIQRTLALNLCFLAAAHHKLGSAPELWRNEFMEAGSIAAEALSRDRQNAKARDEAELIGRQAASRGVRLPPLPAP